MILSGRTVCLLLVLACSAPALALEPNEILVIANADYAASKRLARYYCQQRGIPANHVVPVSLGSALRDNIGRGDYDKRLARPIRRIFSTRPDMGNIKCLVTTYGVPFRVGQRGPLAQSEGRLTELRALLRSEQDALKDEEAQEQPNAVALQRRKRRISELELDIDRITGRETGASVDSELSLVLCRAYELHRWQPNALCRSAIQPFKTLMVCRLDGPDYGIAKGLVDKALAAEAKGLAGTAYVDSRGLYHKKDMYAYYDQSMRDLALLTQLRTSLPVQEEKTDALFAPGSCPGAALYCGWYGLQKYVDAFDFVEGAVGYHIASLEAVSLRNAQSSQWCPSLLRDGITATLGAVGEPYLRAFPEPKAFFLELFNGRCLVEAFYRTKAFNSWQMVLIGDPLYRPFKPKSPNGR
ncbi:MAG: TIGR03790 family protein [Sedimentisphaerales bacterium]|nr:TIGR03790 family protein [Sedimentisphaerales bacterium]